MRVALTGRLVVAGAYALAVALTVVSVLVAGKTGDPAARSVVLVFVLPILGAAFAGGLGPGLFATALSALAASYFGLPPIHSFQVALAADRAQLLFLVVIGVGISLAMRSVRRGRESARTARQRSRNVLARQLRASAEQAKATRFQRFTRDAPIGIVLTSSDGRLQFANEEYLHIIGSSREELESEGRRPGQTPLLGWLCAGEGNRWEREFVRRDGSRVPVLVGVSRQPDGFAAFVIDLTAEKQAQQALKEADRRKSDFLGVLSHELRNPLAPIRNSVYVLDHCDPGSEQARWAKAVIARQVNHLTRMVDDLLDVTRISRGKIELRRASTNLSELVRRSGEDQRVMLQESGLQFSVKLPGKEVWVEGDATRLSQIVGNLLQNAAKFSREGGVVELELVAGDTWVEIHVRDDGAGIDPEILDKLFEPFVQAERTLARSQGGLGLGLALVKGLAELHGGTVRASSGGLGRGAEFVVRLPASTAGTQAPEAARRAPAATARAVRVLVVEDNHDVAESLAQVVELLGHDVEIARDGPVALAKARANPPDIVLCDIGLPGMSGFDVARAFRADPDLCKARLVAVTGYAQPEDRREAAEAGFELHVAKPADPEEIERLLSI
jgi:signal transduction histidine kinase/CheY-like chemotaxis protein